MIKIWPFIYLAGAVYSVIGGYRSLLPKFTAHTNADWIFVTLTFITLSLVPLGAMAYSRSRGVEKFSKPSLNRAPLGWWTDTLQPIRVSWIWAALFWLGSCFSLPSTDRQGVMLFWFHTAWASGLFIGERIVYRVYAKRIV
ncbi:MAG TPA: hypothetical protein VG938_11675 [Verrucomicrobiae bacterium]|jgi:hypothetical protein|nr:hypothetical protein [Verrucomicrobiae bacterium]